MTSMYQGGLWVLRQAEKRSIKDKHIAVGAWWGRQMRNQTALHDSSLGLYERYQISRHVGGFALAVRDLSERLNLGLIQVEHEPDEILRAAIWAAGLGSTPAGSVLPRDSYTAISLDTVWATNAPGKAAELIWPPPLDTLKDQK